MYSHHIPLLPAGRRSSLGPLFFAFVFISSLAPAGLLAQPERTDSFAVSTPGDPTPPHYPDAAHVFNGCHLSTLAFLARFSAEFPLEQGHALVVRMRNADGTDKSHTLAVVSWRGAWWCRDEFFGVFPLGCPASAHPDLTRIVTRVEPLLEKHAQVHMRKSGVPKPSPAPATLSPEQRLHEVETAAEVIPFPHTIFWVRDHTREVPLVLFRPASDQIAVYDPAHGTGVAECSIRDDAKVISLVAARLGYRVDAVRPDFSRAGGALLAATDSTQAELSR
jgi:hypothetical protein